MLYIGIFMRFAITCNLTELNIDTYHNYRFSVVFSVINYCIENGIRISDYERFDKVYVNNRLWFIAFESIQFLEVSGMSTY